MANSNLKTESINGVILRLLKINPGTELDYETYFDKIKTKLILVNSVKAILPPEENDLLREELTRVRKIKNKKLRFKIKEKTVKVSGSVPSPSPSTSQKGGVGSTPIQSSAIVKYRGGDLVAHKQEEPKEEKKDKKSLFTDINKTLGSILKTLSSKFKFEQKQADQERKDQEIEKRSKRERVLEGFSRGVGAIVATTKKMLSPFESIIDRIKRFIFFTLLGKGFTDFLDWLSDKENQKKFDDFVEFLSKRWPALAALYILFGTSFGGLVRGLLKGAARLSVALISGIPKLVAFIRKNKKLSFLVAAALPLITGPAGKGIRDRVAGKISDMLSNKGDTPESDALSGKNPELDSTRQTIDELQKSGGTITPTSQPSKKSPPNSVPSTTAPAAASSSPAPAPSIPKAYTGGMIPRFRLGGMNRMNPFGMGSGMDFYSGVPISGAGQDDTLIAAKTGEAILTEKDQKELNERYIDKNTGQSLNIPQYLSGRKPGSMSMNNIRPLGGFGGGFSGGGIIQKFNIGGIVGGTGMPSISSGGFSINPSINPSISLGGFSLNPSISSGGFSPPPLSPNVNLATSLTNRIQNDPISLFGGSNLIASTAGTVAGSSRGSIGASGSAGTGGTTGGKPKYGANLKFRNPVRGYPNYQPPSDEFGRFFAKIYNIARSLGDPFPEVVAAQAVQESQFGKSQLAREANNLFGQDAPANAPAERKYEYFDPVEQKQHVAYKFPSIEEAIKYRIRIWKQYYGSARTPAEAIRNIARSGYNPHATYPGEIMGIMREYGVDPISPSPMPLPEKPKPKSSNGGNWWDMLNPVNWFNQSNQSNQKNGRQSGGLIKENTGMNIPGGTADRQLTALQPGEFVLPRQTVSDLGVPFIERLVAMTDKNSDAFLKRGSLNVPEITPLKSGGGGIVNLPPIDLSSAGPTRARASGYAGGSSVPSFSAISPMNDRQQNAKVFYGIG